jgi:hypothetical protein
MNNFTQKVLHLKKTFLCIIMLCFSMMHATKSHAFYYYYVYAVNGASAPVGPASYCQGSPAPTYSCQDFESSCTSYYSSNINTITYQWYYDAGIAISGATGTYTANGYPNTVNLTGPQSAVLTTLAIGPHTLYCTFTPNQNNCYSYSYTAIQSGLFPFTILPSTTAPIVGIAATCPTGTTQLSDATPAGVWASSNPAAATVSTTGLVYGVPPGGFSDISYTPAGACGAVVTATISTLPGITATSTIVCPGTTIALTDPIPTGTWSSSNTAIASVSSSGVVTGGISTGLTPSTVTITYSVRGCTTTIPIINNGLPAITGTAGTCPGGTTLLADPLPGGTWSSSNNTVATVDNTGLVNGVIVGTASISYFARGCATAIPVHIAVIPPVQGVFNTCVGLSTPLSDLTPGGVWSIGNTAIATVTSTGVVHGAAVGSTTISYSFGSCNATHVINVGDPLLNISGTHAVCIGSNIALSDTTLGGVWTSANTSIATISVPGAVHGVDTGIATISYSVGDCSVTYTVSVQSPNPGIIVGKDSICMGPGHVISLTDAVPGGAWSSANPSHATVNSSGIVTAYIPGLDTIKYTITNVCGSIPAYFLLHVRTALQCALGVSLGADNVAELQVYPNPNNGDFSVYLTSDMDAPVHIVITNMVGQKVRELTTRTNKLDLIHLQAAPGIYLLTATTDHNKYISKVTIN